MISLYIVTAYSSIQVMRIRQTLTKDQISGYFDKFSLQVPFQMYGVQLEE